MTEPTAQPTVRDWVHALDVFGSLCRPLLTRADFRAFRRRMTEAIDDDARADVLNEWIRLCSNRMEAAVLRLTPPSLKN